MEMLLSLGKKIRELRKARGWTQRQLASAVKITPEYVSKIETGKQSVSIMTLEQIAEALSMELIVDFSKKGEEKKTMEGLLNVLSRKPLRRVKLIVNMMELIEEYEGE